MPDYNRLNIEIRLLVREFGNERVYWHREGEWIMVKDWPLPPNINKRSTNIVVLIPPSFGNGEAIRDAFIDSSIKVFHKTEKKYVPIPHFHRQFPYARLQLGTREEWKNKQWQYICIHDRNSGSHGSIMNYLIHVYKFLDDPFRNWEGTFSSYRK